MSINDPTAVVNAISGKLLGKEVGEPDMDGFRATIMDLLYREYLSLYNIPAESIISETNKKTTIMDLTYHGHLIEDNIPSEIVKKTNNSISFRINDDNELSKLLSFERDIIDFFTFLKKKMV